MAFNTIWSGIGLKFNSAWYWIFLEKLKRFLEGMIDQNL